MIFEPLSLATYRRDTVGGGQIPDGDDRIPGSAITDRIAINFGKAVDCIDPGFRIGYPGDVVFVIIPEVATPVVRDQFFDLGPLQVILGNRGRLFEPEDNLFDRRAVHAADFPGFFDQYTVDFCQL